MLIINGFVNCKQLLQKVSPNQKHFVTANTLLCLLNDMILFHLL